ncbi:MAG: hypothetical protein ACTHU0_33630 [Kofleriaceae bacterium]
MFPRVGGAILALAAVVALALSIATGAWWSGHPRVNDRTITAKDVQIGLVTARGCNTGGDRTCQPVVIKGPFVAIGYASAGATGLLGVTALALALLTWSRSERRKSLARAAIGLAVIASGLAVALIAVGPDIDAAGLDVHVPLGYGAFLFGGGALGAIVARARAMRPTPPNRHKPAGWDAQHHAPTAPPVPVPGPMHAEVPAQGASPMAAPLPAAPAPAEPVDVLALLEEDALRPSSLGPEPMFGGRSASPTAPPPVPPSPGGILPGPSGPLGAPLGVAPPPLFSSAPQLRPLYEAAPGQGGTGGLLPGQPPVLPNRPPTPIPRSQISARAGIPTPPGLDIPSLATARAKPATIPPPVPGGTLGPSVAPVPAVPAARPKTLPPPMRMTNASAPPPVRPPVAAQPPKPSPLAAPHQPTIANAVVPPPAPFGTPIADAPGHPLGSHPGAASAAGHLPGSRSPGSLSPSAAGSRAPGSTTTPPPTGRAPGSTTAPPPMGTTGRASGSMPAVPFPAPGSAPRVPVPSPVATGPRIPMRYETEAGFDAAATAARDPEEPDFDAAATAARDPEEPEFDAAATAARDPEDSEQTEHTSLEELSAADVAEISDGTSPSLAPAPAPGETFESATREQPTFAARPAASDEAETLAREKFSPEELEAPTEASAAPRVPLSTAPSSLPPPSDVVAVGPSPACPQCEAPMAWVEQHLRFYCKACRMYF